MFSPYALSLPMLEARSKDAEGKSGSERAVVQKSGSFISSRGNRLCRRSGRFNCGGPIR